jgi:hypothetical protein
MASDEAAPARCSLLAASIVAAERRSRGRTDLQATSGRSRHALETLCLELQVGGRRPGFASSCRQPAGSQHPSRSLAAADQNTFASVPVRMNRATERSAVRAFRKEGGLPQDALFCHRQVLCRSSNRLLVAHGQEEEPAPARSRRLGALGATTGARPFVRGAGTMLSG